MINQSTTLRYLRMKMGLSHFVSPLTDEQIMEIIKQESRYTFSKYYPYVVMTEVHDSEDQWEQTKGIYYIKSDGLEVMGVSNIYRDSQYLYDKYPMYYNTDPFNYQMYSDLQSMVSVPNTFLFRPPNKVEVFPKFWSPLDYSIEVKCVHPEHLMTIPLSLRDNFYELCEYDVRDAMWEILKEYDRIPTAFATIELQLDRYQSARDDKKTMLERWDEKFYMEPNRKKIFIA